jgi:hypothetical protein
MTTTHPGRHPRPRPIPIQPSAGLWLLARGHGDDARFARLFRTAWLRVPPGCRRRMVAHWRRADALVRHRIGVPRPLRRGEHDPRPAPPGWPWPVAETWPILVTPRVELVYGWVGGRHDDILYPRRGRPPHPAAAPRGHYRKALGMVSARGHLLRFRAGAVDRMPDEVVQDLVAHELGHVYLQASGWHGWFKQKMGSPPEEREEEEEVDIMVEEEWGFGVETIDKWTLKVGLTRLLTFASAEEFDEYERAHGPVRQLYGD